MIQFIYGDSAPLQIKYQEIVNTVKGNNYGIVEKYFDGSQKEDEEKFYETISTNSIFSPKELIIFKRTEQLKGFDNFIKSMKKYDLSQKEIVITYEEILSEFNKIINELKKKQLEAIGEIAKITCYRKDTEKKMTILFIQEELRISQGDADKLIETIGEDYFKIVNEVEKIKNYLDGETFSFEKILPILSVSKEYGLRNLIDKFLIKRDSKDLLSYLQKEKEYMGFLYIMADELIVSLKLNSLIEEKIIVRSIGYNNFTSVYNSFKKLFKKNTGQDAHPYAIFNKIKSAGNFKIKFLQKKLKELLAAEYNVKSGTVEEEIAVESFILNFYNKKDLA